MLYRAKENGDIGVKTCKIVGTGDIYGYELVENFFVDNSGLGDRGEPALIFEDFLKQVKAGYFYGIRDAGQFQVNIGEYKKVDSKKIKDDLGIARSRLISKSCRIIDYKNGNKTIRLYSTDILQFKGKKIILNSGGYKTVTTKARINQFLPAGIKIYQKNGEWFIINNNLKRDFQNTIKFFDGIELEA